MCKGTDPLGGERFARPLGGDQPLWFQQKSTEKWIKNGSTINAKSIENQPNIYQKIDQKSVPEGPQEAPGGRLEIDVKIEQKINAFQDRFLKRFW